MADDGGRASYLLDGRRVMVRDLLEAGLVTVGEELTFTRPRAGETHTAVVEESGSLLVDGRRHVTSSAAARVAAGTGQIDGWTAWVTKEGATLHALRAQLLDAVARETSAEPAEVDEDAVAPSESPLSRHEFLKRARDDADNGKPHVITVRDLLRHWGGRARGSRISWRIEVDLGNRGLTTSPDFLSVTLDDDVSLVIAEQEPATVENGGTGTDSIDVVVFPAKVVERGKIGLTLGNLMAASRTLVWVKPTATFQEAMTKMLLSDFSQLPVLKNKYEIDGAVTWQSIAHARLKDPDALFSDAIVPAKDLPYDHDLNHVLPVLQSDDFVVVRNAHNEISGIVTTADVVGLYGERTLPFLLIGELDQELRQIMTTFDLAVIRSLCERPGQRELTSHDDMTMGDYQRMLANPACWAKLGWPLDRVTFVARLDELRQLRNDIMHFNPDGVPPDAVDMLRNVLSVIRSFGGPEAP